MTCVTNFNWSSWSITFWYCFKKSNFGHFGQLWHPIRVWGWKLWPYNFIFGDSLSVLICGKNFNSSNLAIVFTYFLKKSHFTLSLAQSWLFCQLWHPIKIRVTHLALKLHILRLLIGIDLCYKVNFEQSVHKLFYIFFQIVPF